MLTTRADIVLRAHEVGRDLTDMERIALGATLIQTVLNPAYHAPVSHAAARVRDHGAALADAAGDVPPDRWGSRQIAEALRGAQPIEHPDRSDPTATHEQTGPIRNAAPDGAGAAPRPADAASSSRRWRRAWDQFAASARRIEACWIGDVIALAALVLFILGPMLAVAVVLS